MQDLLAKIKVLRDSGKRIGLCHGVFDLIHSGHVAHFQEAKSQVDFLIVSVTDEKFVNKGNSRPFFSNDKRMEVLKELKAIDYVLLSKYETASGLISTIKPDVYFKGHDYLNKIGSDAKLDEEISAIKSIEGALVITSSTKLSSSSILNNLSSPLSEKFSRWMSTNVKLEDLEFIWDLFNSEIDLSIGIVGDLILDQYNYCIAKGKSGKEPLLAFEEMYIQNYIGGAGAISINAAGLVKNVSLYTLGDERDFVDYADTYPNLQKIFVSASNPKQEILKKTRFVEINSENKVFLKYEWLNRKPHLTHKNFDLSCDVIGITDFGHGFLSDVDIHELIKNTKRSMINSQLNAWNRPPHSLETYAGCYALILNRAELLWHYTGTQTNFEEICDEVVKIVKCSFLVVTLGSEGVYLRNGSGEQLYIPAISNQVRDRVGAGDSLFTLAAIGLSLDLSMSQVGLLANIAGAINVQFVGNANFLKRSDIQVVIETMMAHLGESE